MKKLEEKKEVLINRCFGLGTMVIVIIALIIGSIISYRSGHIYISVYMGIVSLYIFILLFCYIIKKPPSLFNENKYMKCIKSCSIWAVLII